MFNTLFTQDVLSEFDRMNRLFANEAAATQAATEYPAINIAKSDEQVEVYAYAPGLDPASIDVTLHDQILTLKGAKQAREVEDGEQTFAQERFAGDFERTVKIMDDIDTSNVEASYENGVLRITLNRQAKPVARKITVNTH
ncbi:MAG: Heat-shock protein Hsp20 [uncultured Thiotrichaceae bacterium]|uniref:Heat-shock protein Hsp20 n=1 Tax=uncultured Thiotrichaceae bacterium TaxID=298394 RepID=A0A6S6T8B2_9GAMM|nr:MAG: Heat-shock protein Hsp20 [uncultured Thiotrichaceae bacterium]